MPALNGLRSHLAKRSAAAVVALAAAFAAAPAAGMERPGLDESRAFVEKLAEDAVRTWAAHPSDEAARTEAMESLVRTAFDIDFITRAVLGRHWRKLDPGERRQFRELFLEFAIQVYLPHISGYGRDHLRVFGARPRGKRDVLVKSELLTDDGDWIEADWRVRSVKGDIRIIDLTVAGVSLLLVQREEFEAVIRRGGFTSLVQQLVERKNKSANAGG